MLIPILVRIEKMEILGMWPGSNGWETMPRFATPKMFELSGYRQLELSRHEADQVLKTIENGGTNKIVAIPMNKLKDLLDQHAASCPEHAGIVKELFDDPNKLKEVLVKICGDHAKNGNLAEVLGAKKILDESEISDIVEVLSHDSFLVKRAERMAGYSTECSSAASKPEEAKPVVPEVGESIEEAIAKLIIN